MGKIEGEIIKINDSKITELENEIIELAESVAKAFKVIEEIVWKLEKRITTLEKEKGTKQSGVI